MKASREQLKSIMRELFIEILGEAMVNIHAASPTISAPTVRSQHVEQRTQNGRRKPAFDPRLDAPAVGHNGSRLPTDALKEAVRIESHGNPIMADILADTAMKTLPTQLAHGDRMGQPMVGTAAPVSRNSAPIQQEQFNGNPDQVFGDGGQLRADGSSHWADLAFMSNKKTL